MTDDLLVFAINTILNTKFNTRSFISQLLNHDRAVAMETLKRDYLSPIPQGELSIRK